jgi:hypothetical protein
MPKNVPPVRRELLSRAADCPFYWSTDSPKKGSDIYQWLVFPSHLFPIGEYTVQKAGFAMRSEWPTVSLLLWQKCKDHFTACTMRAIMALSRIPNRKLHPQSVPNLALAQVTFEAVLMPPNKAEERRLLVAQDERQEKLDDDPLGPAKGIVNGLRLSVTLWSFIALIVLLMR